MARRKINAAMMLAAGEEAHLQTKSTHISHAKPIDGETFQQLNIDAIEANPMQPRLHIDEEELEDLARSIKLHGLIQPIAVIRIDADRYLLKAGYRRWLAHKKLGLKSIKAIVQETELPIQQEGDKALFEIAVMENTQRDNLNPLELALSLHHAMDRGLYASMEDLSLALGKSKSYISKILKVLALEDTIIKDLAKNRSTNDIEALYEIQKIANSQKQIEVYFDFIARKLDRAAIRALNKKIKPNSDTKPYRLTHRGHVTRLEVNTRHLDAAARQKLHEEIETLLMRYVKR